MRKLSAVVAVVIDNKTDGGYGWRVVTVTNGTRITKSPYFTKEEAERVAQEYREGKRTF